MNTESSHVDGLIRLYIAAFKNVPRTKVPPVSENFTFIVQPGGPWRLAMSLLFFVIVEGFLVSCFLKREEFER